MLPCLGSVMPSHSEVTSLPLITVVRVLSYQGEVFHRLLLNAKCEAQPACVGVLEPCLALVQGPRGEDCTKGGCAATSSEEVALQLRLDGKDIAAGVDGTWHVS